jgi:hypothetical protein
LNGVTSVPNFTNFYQAVQKLLVGEHQTDRRTGDLISLLSFLESRLKMLRLHRDIGNILCNRCLVHGIYSVQLKYPTLALERSIADEK